MKCEEFLKRYSEYRDERAAGDALEELERHREECEACARYDRVVSRGVRVLRGLPSPSPSPDFHDRLRHRIYHLEDRIPAAGSWSTGGAAILAAAAAGLLALAWVPFVSRAPVEVELRPVSVERPAEAVERSVESEPPSLFRSGPFVVPDRPGWGATTGRGRRAGPYLWREGGSPAPRGEAASSLGVGTAVLSHGLR